ncbi:MAG: MMPL family transporter, partial [Coriobacteriales bacterium]
MLNRFAVFVVKQRRAVMAITAVLLVLAAWGMMNQRTNYDMMSYLPQDLDSTKGFTILNDDFGLGNTMQVYIRGESDAKVATLVKKLEAVRGVEAVHWVTDLAPIEQPREFLDKAVAGNYYSDGGTLLQVGFAGTMSDPLVKDAVNEVKRLVEPYDAAIAGAQQIELEESMSSSQLGLILASIGLVTLVLLLTVPSIVVPILFVITIAIGVVMNLGLSYYIGQEVFYLTSVIVFALQFAVTMDYALFLYHRFEEERRTRDTEDAMIVAVQATFKAVMAAALTTIAGFLALTFMRLSFGMDLGLTLARGVAITLLLVVCFLPGLLIDALPLIQRVQHPIPRFDFSRLGRFVARHAGVVALVAVVLLGVAYYGNSRVVESYDIDAGMPT